MPLVIRRNDPREENGHHLLGVGMAKYFKDDVFAGFQLANGFSVFVYACNRLPINFSNQVSLRKADIVGKARRFHSADQHAFASFHAHALSAFWREAFYPQTKFGRGRFVRRVAYPAFGIREDPRTVFHSRRRLFLLLVTVVSDLDLAANGSRCNGIHKVVTGLHRSPVDGCNDVATLQSGLLRRTARSDTLNDNTIRSAKGLERNRIGSAIFLETDADRTAGHAAAFGDLIVNADSHAGRHGETNAFVTASTGQNCGVDADHLSCHIHQRPAGVCGINGLISLQEALELPPDTP